MYSSRLPIDAVFRRIESPDYKNLHEVQFLAMLRWGERTPTYWGYLKVGGELGEGDLLRVNWLLRIGNASSGITFLRFICLSELVL